MSLDKKGPSPRPCVSCPYRQDVPSGVWHPEEYAKLPRYDLPTAQQPEAVFFCHYENDHVCAGWCGTHDMEEALALRLGFLSGLSPEEVGRCREYVSPVPLFPTGKDAAVHGLREVLAPSERAFEIGDKIIDTRRSRRVSEHRRRTT